MVSVTVSLDMPETDNKWTAGSEWVVSVTVSPHTELRLRTLLICSYLIPRRAKTQNGVSAIVSLDRRLRTSLAGLRLRTPSGRNLLSFFREEEITI